MLEQEQKQENVKPVVVQATYKLPVVNTKGESLVATKEVSGGMYSTAHYQQTPMLQEIEVKEILNALLRHLDLEAVYEVDDVRDSICGNSYYKHGRVEFYER